MDGVTSPSLSAVKTAASPRHPPLCRFAFLVTRLLDRDLCSEANRSGGTFNDLYESWVASRVGLGAPFANRSALMRP
jgi:hypothetical protein